MRGCLRLDGSGRRRLWAPLAVVLLGAWAWSCTGPQRHGGTQTGTGPNGGGGDPTATPAATTMLHCDLAQVRVHASELTSATPMFELDGEEAVPIVDPGQDKEHAIRRCGFPDSCAFVATEFRCADGPNPLAGDREAAMRARAGNVGRDRLGHVIDLYRVPCPTGPQPVYVDMYSCPAMRDALSAGLEHAPVAPRPSAVPHEAAHLYAEGVLLRQEGNSVEARQRLQRAVQLTEAAVGPAHPDLAIQLTALGEASADAGDTDAAERTLLRAYDIWDKAGWPDERGAAESALALAIVYEAKAPPAEVQCVLERAVKTYEAVEGAHHDRLVVKALQRLARLHQKSGDHKLAERLLRRALHLTEQYVGARHPMTAAALHALANFYDDQGDTAHAAVARARAKQIDVFMLGRGTVISQ